MRLRSFAGLALVTIVASVQAQELREPARRNPPHSRLLPAAGEQSQPAMATDGQNFLSVWMDGRGGASEIYMNVARRDGTTLSPYGVRLGEILPWTRPVVAWSGSHYLVVWSQLVEPSRYGVSMVRVSRDGELLDARPRLLFDARWGSPEPKIAVNAGVVLIAADARYCFVGEDGEPSAVVENPCDRGIEALVPSGDGFLALSLATFDGFIGSILEGWRIDAGAGGGPVVAAPHRIADDLDFVAFGAASDGHRTLLVYTALRGDRYPVLARFLDGDGVLGDELEIGGLTHRALSWSPVVQVVSAGDGFLVAWERSGAWAVDAATVKDGRVASRFTLLDRPWMRGLPAMASNGRESFVAWSAGSLPNSPSDIYGGVGGAGPVAEPILLARSRAVQETPQIAAGGDGYLVVWTEELQNDGVRSIVAQRYDRDGRPVGMPRLLSDGMTDAHTPRVAFNGELFLVVWTERGSLTSVMGRRVDTGGMLLDVQAKQLSDERMESFGTASLATNGGDFAVVHSSDAPFNHPEMRKAHVVRIDSRLEPTAQVTLDPRDEAIRSEVTITAMGEEYLVTWSHDRILLVATLDGAFPRRAANVDAAAPMVSCDESRCVSVSYDVWGSLTVRPFHPLLDTLADMTAAVTIAYWPRGLALTRGDEGHVVVWGVHSPTGVSVRATRLNAHGEPASPETTVLETRNLTTLAAAAAGKRLAVAYAHANGADGVVRVGVKVVGQE